MSATKPSEAQIEKTAMKIAKDTLKLMKRTKTGKIFLEEIPNETILQEFAKELRGVDPKDYDGGLLAGQKAMTNLINGLNPVKMDIVRRKLIGLLV